MGARCHVCTHSDRAKMELGLARKLAVRWMAQKFGVSKDSLYRHRRDHMPPQLKAALVSAMAPTVIDLDELRRSESEGLLQHIVAQRGRLHHYAEIARECGDIATAVKTESTIIANLTLGARLVGEIATASQHVTNNLVITPEYLALRIAIKKALAPYPSAAQAVSAALRAVEGDGQAAPPQSSPSPLTIEHEAA